MSKKTQIGLALCGAFAGGVWSTSFELSDPMYFVGLLLTGAVGFWFGYTEIA